MPTMADPNEEKYEVLEKIGMDHKRHRRRCALRHTHEQDG